MESQQQETKIVDPNKWKPGKYKAKAIDWGASKTKDGLPQVIVLFQYDQPGNAPGEIEQRQLMWFGNFKGGARPYTLDTLYMLGLRGPVSSLEDGRETKALDENKEVQIVVEHREYNGKVRAGISWVNEVGGIKASLESGEAKSLFADIDAEFSTLLMSKGASGPLTPAQKKAEIGNFSDSDLPF